MAGSKPAQLAKLDGVPTRNRTLINSLEGCGTIRCAIGTSCFIYGRRPRQQSSVYAIL